MISVHCRRARRVRIPSARAICSVVLLKRKKGARRLPPHYPKKPMPYFFLSEAREAREPVDAAES